MVQPSREPVLCDELNLLVTAAVWSMTSLVSYRLHLQMSHHLGQEVTMQEAISAAGPEVQAAIRRRGMALQLPYPVSPAAPGPEPDLPRSQTSQSSHQGSPSSLLGAHTSELPFILKPLWQMQLCCFSPMQSNRGKNKTRNTKSIFSTSSFCSFIQQIFILWPRQYSRHGQVTEADSAHPQQS